MTARRPIRKVPATAHATSACDAVASEAEVTRAEAIDAGDAPRPYWSDWLLPDGSECPNCAHQGARCGDMH